jgi:hypothetical protein
MKRRKRLYRAGLVVCRTWISLSLQKMDSPAFGGIFAGSFGGEKAL